jgi:RNA polymerase sigma-70 factor (ECF subfamily)
MRTCEGHCATAGTNAELLTRGSQVRVAVAVQLTSESAPVIDDEALVRAAQVQPEAFAALYDRYWDRVYWYVRTRTASEEDTADLTQHVFVQALGHLHQYDPRRGQFGVWLFAIARNVSANFHRRQRPSVAWDLVPECLRPHASDDPVAETLRREDLDRLGSLVRALDPDKRELLVLRFVAGLTVGEIARLIGKREEATRKQLGRTLHMLAEEFEGGTHDP